MASLENKEIVNILKQFFSEIYHHKAPINGVYPVVVYKLLTQSASLRADNRTKGFQAVYRITVIDKVEYNPKDLILAFENAGWLWENTNVTVDTGENEIDEVYTTVDISKLLLV